MSSGFVHHWIIKPTIQQLEDTGRFLLHLQVIVGTVGQHDPVVSWLLQPTEEPERQVQHQTHGHLHSAGSKVHGLRLHHKHLRTRTGGQLKNPTTFNHSVVVEVVQP